MCWKVTCVCVCYIQKADVHVTWCICRLTLQLRCTQGTSLGRRLWLWLNVMSILLTYRCWQTRRCGGWLLRTWFTRAERWIAMWYYYVWMLMCLVQCLLSFMLRCCIHTCKDTRQTSSLLKGIYMLWKVTCMCMQGWCTCVGRHLHVGWHCNWDMHKAQVQADGVHV